MVDINISAPCEPFTCAKDSGDTVFPLSSGSFYEEFTGTNYWNRKSQASAYGSGTGSVRFNAWSASAGTIQSLISYQFNPAGGSTYLTFDAAYRPWSGGNVDSLIVESSVNGGVTYTVRARLWGGLGAAAGPLNSVFTGGGQFIPSNREWRPKIYQLPAGTNKVRLRARSGFGNDIWLDNICVQSLPTAVNSSIGLANEAMFIPTNPFWRLQDTIRVYLHRTDFPNIAVDSAISVVGSNAVVGSLLFNKALDGTYYRVVKHRNSIETWSNIGVAYTRGSGSHHNFIQPSGQAYGNNQAIVSITPEYRGIFSGDCDQDDFIDIADLAIIDNQVFNFAAGYVIGDLNGDLFVDLTDYTYADNNSNNFVGVVAPPGAEPVPPVENESTPELNTEQDRIKYELHLKVMNEKGNVEESVKVKPELNDVLRDREIRSNIQKTTFRKKDNTRVEKSETGTSEQTRVGER
ncbi:MAG: hypothetical protein IPM38_12510 [Ignavibacteria bacterium]|nr:hypothetical protein [Ignavibacteria bacterium]